MLFSENIRREYNLYFYGKTIRYKRLIICLIILFLISLFILIRKKETCWIDYYRSRLFCFVLINEEHLENRGRAIYETWGHRCGKFVFIVQLNSSSSYNIFDNDNSNIKKDQLPIQYIPQLPIENYSNLPEKVRRTLLFLNKYYSNYDWYLKADDDTFIIVENLLRFLISTIKRRPQSVLYGYRFREEYYVSGGSGYVLTRKGIELFGKYMNDNNIYSKCNSTMEDMMIGLCLQKIFEYESIDQINNFNIVGDSIDQQGRERFHPLAFRLHFNGPANKYRREWIYFRPFHHNLFGYEGISETTISFHYTSPDDMYQIDTFLYQIRLFHKQVCFQNLEK